MVLKINFLKLKDINLFKKFINDNWKKNHVFLRSNLLIKWQHNSFNKRLDFYAAKEGNKIISLLGIINQSRDIKYKEISLAIWVSTKRSIGSKLFLNLEKKFKFKIVKGTTVDEKIIPMYKLFGFIVKKFNIYYLTNLPIKKQKLSKNLIPSKLFNLKPLINIEFNDLKNINNINLKYFKWRFFKHPFYRYSFITDDFKKFVIIYRIIKIKNYKIMRIVDFIGTFKNKNQFIKKLNFYLHLNDIEYLEFFHFGFEDKFITKIGLKKLNKNQKISIYTEPFMGLFNKNFYCCYKTKSTSKIKIVRADGDFDRPSVI